MDVIVVVLDGQEGQGNVNKRRKNKKKKRTMNGVDPQIMVAMAIEQLLPSVGLCFVILHRTAPPFL